jgi:NADH-ubiquinone oxidoreductase chain 2
MLLHNLLNLLLAIAVSRREKSIFYNRVATLILSYCSMIALQNISIKEFNRGKSIYGGLYQTTGINHSFEMIIYIVGGIILQLTVLYPYLQNKIKGVLESLLNKFAETYSHPEYSSMILFILLGATLLTSSSDLVSMFLAIELQSYGCAPGEACVAEIL